MLRASIVVGAYLGDEGKGKYVAGAARGQDAVLRVNGSTSAGHRVDDGERTYVARQLPSLFFPEKTMLVIAPGALLNLSALAEEVEARPDLGALRGKVRAASSVSLLVRPYIDKGRGFMSQLIGSTHQGTGPAAVARAARHSLHLYDVHAAVHGGAEGRAAALEKVAITCRETLPDRFGSDSAENARYREEVLAELVGAYRRLEACLGGFCVDYTAMLVHEMRAGSWNVTVEGCNGLLLDNLHGAHPNVTSASTNVGALLCGANLSPADVEKVVVVAAAYCTCLGKRVLPTEMTPEEARHFYRSCDEVDVAEGHPRRIAWLDLPGLRKAMAGCAGAVVHLNKLDVLSGLARVKVCTHYEIDGRDVAVMPDDPAAVRRARPVYEVLDGWDASLRDVRRMSDLPPAARAYVEAVSRRLPLPIASVGVGSRNQDLAW